MGASDEARGRWPGILRQLGVDQEYLTGKHGPCPMCGGKDRFRFDDKEGRGTYYCSKCGAGDGYGLLMKMNNWGFLSAMKEVENVIGKVEFKPIPKKKDPLPRLKRIASGAKALGWGDPVVEYLQGRGVADIPKELKYHPGLEYYDGKKMIGKFPAMLAVVQNAAGDNLTYHVTYLGDGKKADVPAPKKLMPPLRPLQGAAVRLFGTGDHVVEHICLSEGIETAIAAHEATGLPSWAAISAGGLESVKLPKEITRVTIFADNDKSYTGQKAAYALAARLVSNNVRADVIMSCVMGEDFADVWANNGMIFTAPVDMNEKLRNLA